MAKQKKKPARSSTQSSKSDDLKARLARLPADQLIAIVETFLARVGEKQRLEFLNLLPAVRSEDLEVHLPYRDDDDFIAEVDDFFERLGNEEFIEYGVGYDPEEHAHHGYGDDSWIGEMDRLFETAELYFLARHYETAEQAYQTLFECFDIEGYCFTTSDPQAALRTDLVEARSHCFQSLRRGYSGNEMAEKIIEGFSQYRYIGKNPPQLHELFPEDDEVIRLLEAVLIKKPASDDARTMPSELPCGAEEVGFGLTQSRLISRVHNLSGFHLLLTGQYNDFAMATITAPTLIAPVTTAYQAQAQAGGFLNDCMPDRFCAGRPRFDSEAQVWRVPVLLSYAVIGPVGQVGEILVSTTTGEVISATPKEEMMAAARLLYEQNREEIEAPVS